MTAMEKIIELLQDAEHALFEARNEVEESDIQRSEGVSSFDIEDARRSVESIIRNVSAEIKRD